MVRSAQSTFLCWRIAVPSPTTIRRIALHFRRTGVIDVVTVIAATGEDMKTIEEIETAQAQAVGDQPKGAKTASVAKRAANVAPKKGKPAKAAPPAKKAPKGT